ncbi:MAG TPA: patatin-like phospholipase family protein [Acidimicrobiales bacterium]|nr:patatin-like phospholipase family protein [Acidimicrobiales bacterium]
MTRALVLGGGGPVGVAWEVGLLAGLVEVGVDLTDADQIVGTSAGSIVGARIALGEAPADSLEQGAAQIGDAAGTDASVVDAEALLAIGMAMFESWTGTRSSQEVIAQLGRMSAEATTVDEDSFVELVSAGTLGDEWPDRDYRCTAIDIETGEFVAWSAASGVPLDRAVASSCAVPGIFPPVTIDGRRYMDGGVQSGTNAQLVAGADTVVIVSVISGLVPPMAELLRTTLDEEVDALRAGGAAVEVIEFDQPTVELVAGNLMAFDNSHAVGAAGMAQAAAEAERIGAVWG